MKKKLLIFLTSLSAMQTICMYNQKINTKKILQQLQHYTQHMHTILENAQANGTYEKKLETIIYLESSAEKKLILLEGKLRQLPFCNIIEKNHYKDSPTTPRKCISFNFTEPCPLPPNNPMSIQISFLRSYIFDAYGKYTDQSNLRNPNDPYHCKNLELDEWPPLCSKCYHEIREWIKPYAQKYINLKLKLKHFKFARLQIFLK